MLAFPFHEIYRNRQSDYYQYRVRDPNWNSDADVVPQLGIIDTYDIVTTASRCGQTCP